MINVEFKRGKHKLRRGDNLKKLQRWVNSRFAFSVCEKFEDYKG